MKRAIGIVLLSAATLMALAAGASAGAHKPTVSAAGNGGMCSLSAHKSFHLEGSGWKPRSTVQLTILYPDSSPKGGKLYSPLANKGRYKVDVHGSFRSKNEWTCWPTPALNYPDYTGTYLVFAHQLGARPPKVTMTYFRIVK